MGFRRENFCDGWCVFLKHGIHDDRTSQQATTSKHGSPHNDGVRVRVLAGTSVAPPPTIHAAYFSLSIPSCSHVHSHNQVRGHSRVTGPGSTHAGAKMSGDGQQSSSRLVKGVRQGISIRLDGLFPIHARKTYHYLCGNPYFFLFLLAAALCDSITEHQHIA